MVEGVFLFSNPHSLLFAEPPACCPGILSLPPRYLRSLNCSQLLRRAQMSAGRAKGCLLGVAERGRLENKLDGRNCREGGRLVRRLDSITLKSDSWQVRLAIPASECSCHIPHTPSVDEKSLKMLRMAGPSRRALLCFVSAPGVVVSTPSMFTGWRACQGGVAGAR